MRKSLAILFILAIAFGCSYKVQAQEFTVNKPEEHHLWKGEQVPYSQKRVKMYIYNPEGVGKSAVIVLPGGSYYWLGIIGEGHKVAKYLAQRGITAVVLRYSTGLYGAHYPYQTEDVRACVKYLKENAGRYGIDSCKIGALGFSAGGHLAGCAALDEDDNTRVAFAGLIYPVITMSKPYAHKTSKKYLLRGDLSLEHALSLEERVASRISEGGKVAPLYLLHCEDDKVVDIRGTRDFADSLAAHGFTDCEINIYDTGGHGFGLKPAKDSQASDWCARFIDWMKLNGF